VYGEQALARRTSTTACVTGRPLNPFAGIPVSVKDLFDVAGDTTLAGSTLLKGAPVAERDARAVARLRAAGFVVIGRSNMTSCVLWTGSESQLRHAAESLGSRTGRIPGGSSSGAAVSVTDAMAYGALGTDTVARAGFRRRCAASSDSNQLPAGSRWQSVPTVALTGLDRTFGPFRGLLCHARCRLSARDSSRYPT